MPQLLPTTTSPSASINAGLIEVLWLLEQRLATWSSNQDAFSDLLRHVFAVQLSTCAEMADLMATNNSSCIGISLQNLDATTMDGLIAATPVPHPMVLNSPS